MAQSVTHAALISESQSLARCAALFRPGYPDQQLKDMIGGCVPSASLQTMGHARPVNAIGSCSWHPAVRCYAGSALFMGRTPAPSAGSLCLQGMAIGVSVATGGVCWRSGYGWTALPSQLG